MHEVARRISKHVNEVPVTASQRTLNAINKKFARMSFRQVSLSYEHGVLGEMQE